MMAYPNRHFVNVRLKLVKLYSQNQVSFLIGASLRAGIGGNQFLSTSLFECRLCHLSRMLRWEMRRDFLPAWEPPKSMNSSRRQGQNNPDFAERLPATALSPEHAVTLDWQCIARNTGKLILLEFWTHLYPYWPILGQKLVLTYLSGQEMHLNLPTIRSSGRVVCNWLPAHWKVVRQNGGRKWWRPCI